MIYQTFFANKNETFIKFIKEKMEPINISKILTQSWKKN